MADATDLKSVEGNLVRVRLPPSAPILISRLQITGLCPKVEFNTFRDVISYVREIRGSVFEAA